MLLIAAEAGEQARLQRLIDSTDGQIDALVASRELYGLTVEEVAVVEGRGVGGGNYQTLINEALREYMQSHKEPLEDNLRRVIRKELQTHAA